MRGKKFHFWRQRKNFKRYLALAPWKRRIQLEKTQQTIISQLNKFRIPCT